MREQFCFEEVKAAKIKAHREGIFFAEDQDYKPFPIMELAREMRDHIYEAYLNESKPYNNPCPDDWNEWNDWREDRYATGSYPEGLFKPFSYTHQLSDSRNYNSAHYDKDIQHHPFP